MDNIYHEKEEEGIFYGAFSYLTEGAFPGTYEAKCSHVCINILLQKRKYVDGLAVNLDERGLKQTIDALHITNYFSLSKMSEVENLFLVNWGPGQLEVFGSLIAIYQVLKSLNLILLPVTATLHPVVISASAEPEKMNAYLYLLENHWMVLRQFRGLWYKFDPWLDGAQILSDNYVSLYVKQLMADGKLVFIVNGNFPPCPADEVVESIVEPEMDLPGIPSLQMTETEIQEKMSLLKIVDEEDAEEALAMLLSLEDNLWRNQENEIIRKVLIESSAGTSCLQKSPGSSSSDSDDLSIPFSVIFSELGEGAKCYDAPENLLNDHSESISSQCLLMEDIIKSNSSKSSSIKFDPSAPSVSAPTPSVTISTADISSFKKAVHCNEEANKPDEDKTEEETCCICWANIPTHIVVPCGHYCLCNSCSLNVVKPLPDKSFCPLCKQECTNIIRVYK